MNWKSSDARNHFRQLIDRALQEGPQRVSRHGRETVVVVSIKEFDRLTGKKNDFIEFLLSAPSMDGLDLRRQN